MTSGMLHVANSGICVVSGGICVAIGGMCGKFVREVSMFVWWANLVTSIASITRRKPCNGSNNLITFYFRD